MYIHIVCNTHPFYSDSHGMTVHQFFTCYSFFAMQDPWYKPDPTQRPQVSLPKQESLCIAQLSGWWFGCHFSPPAR